MGKEYQIAVLPGDGIGPEVVAEGLKVLKRVSEIEGFKYKLTNYPHGSEHYLKTKELFPDSVLNELKQQDAIYLGAIGDPRVEVGLVERAVIAGIRFGLDLYVNLRPIKLLAEHLCPIKEKKPEDIDLVVVRENTEDLYAGIGGFLKKGTKEEVALQEMVFTRKGCERVIRYAFDLAAKRRKKLTLVDKANAIRAMDIWTRTFAEVGREYPQVATDHAYIDAACMWLVKNPEQFDTVVTSNLFGDILTDLGAVLQGGMGIAASGNIHPGKVSMFEPIHGSAPKYKGKGVASPVAAISACGMMLEYLGEARAAVRIEKTIAGLLQTKKILSLDSASGLSTAACGDLITGQLSEVGS
ncbi:MAG TPA: 3-isopropylmalate dehydrogenase [candidate division Zixibacteria bacterium]|nr:3-isopropylmalate dehydrogenase [candidate division Zixibacteria bacterium]